MNTNKNKHDLAVTNWMQRCIVTSLFSAKMKENREGRLLSREGVIGLLNARLCPFSRNSAKNRFFAAPVRSILAAPGGSAPWVRGTDESGPPDDDWQAYQE